MFLPMLCLLYYKCPHQFSLLSVALIYFCHLKWLLRQ
uniref:Uncharacterized protein n=1 Tax=Anguilla anguilla TaxID=7936 RepID=A0A0E9WGN2_ANGAN